MRSKAGFGALVLLTATSCMSPSGPDLSVIDEPEARAVHLATTGCGFSSDRTGSGILVDDGLVLTVAHVVARSDDIEASVGGKPAISGVVTAIDLERDLALVRIKSAQASPIETTRLGEGSIGRIVGGATSGTIPFEIITVLGITTEEILGDEMHRRLGYELAAAATTGDSGAGAYDDEDRLVGILFATHETEPTSWITAAEEIEDFLGTYSEATEPLVCDPEESRLG